ncbi:MAG: asparagine synthase (glutamine-hydrolyzing) [Lentisphaerae bacterium GWF2_52_8]|nr:MAG: asparagine synthase (glutamine-hydrolyzing) [Lentisphaerae bacterium GWF2_52_8]
MCGILVNIGAEEIRKDHPALEMIRHRGPDGCGAVSFDLPDFRVGLGHRRLSIIDLSERGAQPMSYEDGRYWITFNGEIYNYVELRKELSAEGYKFVSDCDTEVLLAAYRHWGQKCLQHFNGMFAFCIYDTQRKGIFIARDRLGIKPLYYVNQPGCFRAVSEIKQFLSMPSFRAKANKLHLYHFLNSGDFSFDGESMWESVRELEPGHFIEILFDGWRPGDPVASRCWYEIPWSRPLEMSFEVAAAEFRRILEDSVKLRLRADVPVGFLLSGGLDSSTLVGLAHKVPREAGAALKTYSSCYEDKSVDEREFINAVLEFTGAESCLHFPKPEDFSRNLDKVIWHNDLPVLHGSPTAQWLLYERIKAENDARKVIIEGQGGDEILCGYGDFQWAALYEDFSRGRLCRFGRQFRDFQSRYHEPLAIIARKFFRMACPGRVSYPANKMLNASRLLGTEIPPQIAVRREAGTVVQLHRQRLTLLRYILHNVDRNSMAHSRETRVPFLDYRLVEFCLRLPVEHKISHGISKRVLRESTADVLPEKVRARVDKRGYSSPVKNWARTELREFLQGHFDKILSMPFVNADPLRSYFKSFTEEDAPFDPVLWRLMAVSRWQEIFGVEL